jgi:hypothetical protein
MKCIEIKGNNFKPFSINIEIESEDEAKLLFLVFYANNLRDIITEKMRLDKRIIDRTDFNHVDRNKICEILHKHIEDKFFTVELESR